MHQLDAVPLLTRLEVEALGPYAVVERGEREKALLTALHHGQWRAHAARRVAAEQIAAAEGVAPEDLVVFRIERLPAAARELAARDAAHDGRHGLDRPVHFGADVAQDRVAFSSKSRGDAPARALLAAGPDEPAGAQLEAPSRGRRLRGHLARVEP